MKNKLIVIGAIGSKRCYLNITTEEAIERYKEYYSDYDEEYVLENIKDLEVIEFVDEFVAYDIYS